MLGPAAGMPSFVEVRARPESVFNDCPEDVRKQVEEHGGTSITGWAVWERPNAYLFTEFHMVWQSPSGELLDVSAKADGETRVLFVPDPSISYTGGRIHGAHLPLTDDPVILEYIRAHEAYWEAYDRTYGADCFDEVRATPEVATLAFRLDAAVIALDHR
jgi:hypothetical protein